MRPVDTPLQGQGRIWRDGEPMATVQYVVMRFETSVRNIDALDTNATWLGEIGSRRATRPWPKLSIKHVRRSNSNSPTANVSPANCCSKMRKARIDGRSASAGEGRREAGGWRMYRRIGSSEGHHFGRSSAFPMVTVLFAASRGDPLHDGLVLDGRRGPSEQARDLTDWLVFGCECPESIQFCCCPRLSNVWARGILHGAWPLLRFGVRYSAASTRHGTFDLDPGQRNRV